MFDNDGEKSQASPIYGSGPKKHVPSRIVDANLYPVNRMNIKIATISIALVIALSPVVHAQVDERLSVSATYAFESEFVFRGVQIAGDTFTPSVEARYKADENMDLYFGLWTSLPVQKVYNSIKEHEYYAGVTFPVFENLKLDLGGSYYQYRPYTDDSTVEGYVGLTWESLLSPAVYYYYDADMEESTVEISAGYTIPIDLKTGLILGGYVGYSEFAGDSKYIGLMADLSYSFTRYARATIGARMAHLDPEEDLLDTDTRLWWGASFTAGF